MKDTKNSLVDICMEETGGLGVDCIVDNGGKANMTKIKYLKTTPTVSG